MKIKFDIDFGHEKANKVFVAFRTVMFRATIVAAVFASILFEGWLMHSHPIWALSFIAVGAITICTIFTYNENERKAKNVDRYS